MLFRTWIASALVGTGTAWVLGLNPLSPHLYEAIIHGCLIGIAGILIMVFGAIRSWGMVTLVCGLLPIAMGYSQMVATRDINPGSRFTRYEGAVPASVSTWIENGAIRGRVTNRHPRDWMRLATVLCTPAYGNGEPSKFSREISVSEGGWLAPGEHADRTLMDSKGSAWQPDMVMYLTACRVTSGEFYEAPRVVPQFAYNREDINYRYVFSVTNNQQQSMSRISFSCWVLNDAQGSTPHKQDLVMRPLYGDGNSYIARPGETVVLYSTESFAGRKLSNCAAKDVTWVSTL